MFLPNKSFFDDIPIINLLIAKDSVNLRLLSIK